MKNRPNSEPDTQSFDWEAVRRRILQAGAALTELDYASPEVMQQIWARRAAQIAQAPPQEDKGERLTLVVVRLGREVYGLDAQLVFDIQPVEQLTPVPRVPNWVGGVVNLRGRILSVLDLQRFFGLSPTGNNRDDGEQGSLVVVETPYMELALLVDEVLAVEALPTSQMQDTTDTIRGLPPEYIHGILPLAGNKASSLVLVLNLVTLLADERLIIHEEIA